MNESENTNRRDMHAGAKGPPGDDEAADAGTLGAGKLDVRIPPAQIEGQLDRLVCDELDEAGRARLLAWLDEDPRRWRSCGLAFLEAQTWSRALSGSGLRPEADRAARFIPTQAAVGTRDAHGYESARLVAAFPKPDGSNSADVHASLHGSRRTRRRRAVGAVAMAACLLLAFGLGVSLRELVAPVTVTSGPARNKSALPNMGEESPPGTPQKVAPSGPTLAAVTVRPASGMGPAATIRIPVTPAADAASAAAWQMADLPEYVQKQWERRGYRVSKQRRYLFATLPNGESVVVPVEQFQVEHVKTEVY